MSSPSELTAGGASTGQYLTFLLAESVFAVDIAAVREIIQFGTTTAVPLMPDFVRGVINLRGAVVPVIDLQARFGKPAAVVGKKTCIVIVNVRTEDSVVEMGLLVDAVSEVIDIAADQIEPPPRFGGAVRRDFIDGMGKVGNRFVIIVRPERALDMDELTELCEAGTAEPVAA